MGSGDGFVQGIDVSKWQASTPDLTGAHYLIARRGIADKLDAMYDTHIAAARKAGIVTGSYWFGWGSMPVSIQVNSYVANEGDVDLHVLDWEGADGFSAAQARSFISLYQSRTGKRIGLYASEGRFTDLGQDWNWIANYSRPPVKHYDIWQYGPFHGADGDYFPGTIEDLRAFAGKDSNVTQAAITDQTPKLVAATTKTNYYDLDGKTVVATKDTGFTERLSPYGVGIGADALRAIYSTVTAGAPMRLVLVRPDTIRDVPDATPFDQAAIDAATLNARSQLAELQASFETQLASAIAADRLKAKPLVTVVYE